MLPLVILMINMCHQHEITISRMPDRMLDASLWFRARCRVILGSPSRLKNIKWRLVAKPTQPLLALSITSGSSTSASQQLNMPSKVSQHPFSPRVFLSAVTLAALLLSASGAPLVDTPTDMPAGEPSGEEQAGPSDLLGVSPIWHAVLGATRRHQKEVSGLSSRKRHGTEFHFMWREEWADFLLTFWACLSKQAQLTSIFYS